MILQVTPQFHRKLDLNEIPVLANKCKNLPETFETTACKPWKGVAKMVKKVLNFLWNENIESNCGFISYKKVGSWMKKKEN